MKYAAALLFVFIVIVVVLADSGEMPHVLKVMYDFPGGDKAGHLILFGLLNFLTARAWAISRPNESRLRVVLFAAYAGIVFGGIAAYFGKRDLSRK